MPQEKTLEKTKEELAHEELRRSLARAWAEMPLMGGCLRSFYADMTLDQVFETNLANMKRMAENAKHICAKLTAIEKENQDLRGQRDAIREFLGLKTQ